MKNQTWLLTTLFLATWGFVASCPAAESSGDKEQQLLKTYEVNKKVCDFAPQEDLSTPESAYAAINRIQASGEQVGWRRLNASDNPSQIPEDAPKLEIAPEIAQMRLNARIVEVRVCKGDQAAVIAELTRTSKPALFDIRFFVLEKGRWMNRGQPGPTKTLEEARNNIIRSFARFYPRPARQPVSDPAAYLASFVEFLKSNAQDPKAFVMKALAEHKVTIMGEIHHRPSYWAFNASLVTDPAFARNVGTIYLELPLNDQGLVDKFLADPDFNTAPVIEMLRDQLWMGWPDQPMLDFFMTVWRVNQDLPSNQRLRIVLVDMLRPWKEIIKKGDWAKFDVDRDKLMAENILKDLREHSQDVRNALFIVGVGHTGKDLRFFEGTPLRMAGWHLREAMGKQVYAIFQHCCIMSNMGDVKGRLCEGLFESAFAALDNKPMAFPLNTGPFGKQPYDRAPEEPVAGTYRDGFDAYLYLGPIEYELFSPLIAGFYTDEFVKEIDRRHQLLHGKGLVESYKFAKLDAEHFIRWMNNDWGQPRWTWSNKVLGPLDTWQYGSKENIQERMIASAKANPQEVQTAARLLFEAIRTADYKRDWKSRDKWNRFLPNTCAYMASSGFNEWVFWICDNFKNNPIQDVEVGEVSWRKSKDPTRGSELAVVGYKLTLKDGTVLEGKLPFYYSPGDGVWNGMWGLDWHIKYPSGLPAKSTP